MRTRFAIFTIIAFFVVAGCGTGRYGDLRSVMDDTYTATEDYASGLEGVKSPADLAKVLNRYCDQIEKLAPRIKEMRTKYPEFNFKSNSYPAELKDMEEKFGKQNVRVKAASMKITQYMLNQEVMTAFMRLGNAASKM